MFSEFKCFHRSFIFCSFLALALFAASCSKNEEVRPERDPDVNLKGTSCLTETPRVFENYLNGRSSDGEVNQFWNCVRTALLTFQTRVEGSDPAKGYKSTELQRFLQVNFLGGYGKDAIILNETLLHQFMLIKQIFVGGHHQWLTNKEIDQTLNLIHLFQDITVQLRPHIVTLFKTKKENPPSPESLSAALNIFEQSLFRLGGVVSRHQITYSFEDLKVFLKEIDFIFQSKGHGDDFARMIELLPLFTSIKGVLFGGVSDRIRPQEWSSFFRIAGQATSILLRYNFYVHSESLKNASLLNEVDRLGMSVISILNEAFSFRENFIIPHQEIKKVIVAYSDLYTLPMNLTVDKAFDLWTIAVDKILPSYNNNIIGFALQEFKRFQFFFNDWINVQFALLGQSRPVETYGLDEMKVLLDSHPLPLDELGRIIFSNDPNLEWDETTKVRLNLMRAALGAVLQAFSKDQKRAEKRASLNKEEFDKAYSAVKPFLVLFDIVEENDTTLHDRVFGEGDLFTRHSNGDDMLSLYEVVEYAHLVLAGVDTGKIMVSALQKSCENTPNPKPMDSVNANCFRLFYRPHFYHAYSNMPLIVQYFMKLSEKDWKETLRDLEITNRKEGEAETPIINSDIYEMGVLIQYIEVVMLRFDLNQDGVLDTQEGLRAFPLFRNVIARILGLDPVKGEKDARALFTYLLKYGEPPSMKKPLSLLRFIHWKLSETKWSFNADRGTILKILSSLQSQ